MSYVLTLNCHQNVVYTGSYSTEENKQPLLGTHSLPGGSGQVPSGEGRRGERVGDVAELCPAWHCTFRG